MTLTERGAEPNKLHGASKMLIVFIDEGDKLDHMALYEAIVRHLKKADVAGATVLRGIMGYGGQHRIYGSGTMGIADNRPISIIAVDTEAKIISVLPEIESMVREGLILVVDAVVRKYGLSSGAGER